MPPATLAKKPISCEVCDKPFSSEVLLRTHIATVHSQISKTFQCSTCDKEFKSYTGLKHHNDIVHCKNTYKCRKCDNIFSQRLSLARHVATEHKIYCDICDKKFKNSRGLNIHKTRAHRDQRENSAPLDFDPDELDTSDETDDDKKTRRAQCHTCFRDFENYSGLKEHLDTSHQKLLPFKCGFCDKGFKTNSDQLQHLDNVHPEFRRMSKQSESDRVSSSSDRISISSDDDLDHLPVQLPRINSIKSLSSSGSFEKRVKWLQCINLKRCCSIRGLSVNRAAILCQHVSSIPVLFCLRVRT